MKGGRGKPRLLFVLSRSTKKWPPEKTEKLRQLIEQKMSWRLIANELGICCTSAIKKAKREGMAKLGKPLIRKKYDLTNRPKGPKKPRKKYDLTNRPKGPKKPRKKYDLTNRPKKVRADMDFTPEPEKFVTILEVREGQCRWPMGEPSVDMPCCGKQSLAGESYCEYHVKKSYEDRMSRRNRTQKRLIITSKSGVWTSAPRNIHTKT